MPAVVLLSLCSVAAMPHPKMAHFRAGTLPPCTDSTGNLKCNSIGNTNCTSTYVSCSGGSVKNAIECDDGLGNQATGCDGKNTCDVANNATRNTNCK
jgi:hypothetical protein